MAEYTVSVNTDEDGDGSAEFDYVTGTLQSVSIEYNTTAEPTVVITEVGGAGRTVLNLAAANTNTEYRPQYPAHGVDGAAIEGIYAPMYLQGRRLLATVEGADADTEGAVVVRLLTS